MTLLTVGLTPAIQRVMVFDRVMAGEVSRAVETRVCPAGKSVNAARAGRIAAGGLEVFALAVQGQLTGTFCRDELARAGIQTLGPESAHETRTCVTVIDRSTGGVTELVEESRGLSDTIVDLAVVAAGGARADGVVCAGSLTPGAPADFYARVLSGQGDRAALVDARGEALLSAMRVVRAGAKVAKLNAEELRATTGKEEIGAGVEALLAGGATHVVVSDGPRAVYVAEGARRWRLTPPRVRVLNTTGCGDCLAGALMARWLSWGMARGDFLGAVVFGVAASAASAEALLPAEFDLVRAEGLVGEVGVEEGFGDRG